MTLSKNHKENKLKPWQIVAAGLILCVFFAVFAKIHFVQLATDEAKISDLWIHVKIVREGDLTRMYSLSAVIFWLLLQIMPTGLLIPLFLALVETATILAIWWFLLKMWPSLPGFPAFILSAMLNIAIAAYFPGAEYLYLGTLSSSIWHNSTYTLLKPCAVFVLYYFLQLYQGYHTGIRLKQWLPLCIWLTLATLTKPNLLVSLAPAVAILLLVDVIRSKGKLLGRAAVIGLSAVPSFLVMLAQYVILFDTQAGQSIVWAPFGVIGMYGVEPLYTSLRSLAFLLVSAYFLAPFIWKQPSVRVAWLNLAIALVYSYFLAESGLRYEDGNFMWSGHIAVFLAMLVMLGSLCSQMQKNPPTLKNWPLLSGYILQWGAFALHVVAGVRYLQLLLLGQSFIG